MIPFFLIVFLVSFVIFLPLWLREKRRKNFSRIDYTYAFLPIIFWIFITGLGIGPQSLANLIEVPMVLVMSALFYGVKMFAFSVINASKKSVVFLLIILLAVIFLRIFMPLIPE